MDTNSINLLRTQSVLSEEELILLNRLKFVSIIVIFIVAVMGLFVGAAYLAGKLQYNQLEDKRVTLSKTISTQAKKQILLLSLQDRLPIIEKALAAQYPWDGVVQNLANIVSPPYLKTLAIGQNNAVTAVAEAESLEQVESMVVETLKQTQEKKIRSPNINSLVITRDGTIEVSISFIPIL